MTDKELHRLRREDLLQILISQQKQIEDLTAALESAEAALADRRIRLEQAGSIAEAALRLNGVFEAAQRAADEYVAEVKRRADAAATRSGAPPERPRTAGQAPVPAEEAPRGLSGRGRGR